MRPLSLQVPLITAHPFLTIAGVLSHLPSSPHDRSVSGSFHCPLPISKTGLSHFPFSDESLSGGNGLPDSVMALTVHPEIHFREGYPHLCCTIAWMFSFADEVSVFTLLCLTQDPSPLPGPRRRKRDSRWEDKVPVSPRKEASKQGGLTLPSSLMRPGEEAWRRPGF